MKSDSEVIESVREAHIAALNARDAAAWVDLFTDDAAQMPPNARANAGKANIRSWAEGFLGACFFGAFKAKFSLYVAELQVAGDRAFESGAYAITLTPDAGGQALSRMPASTSPFTNGLLPAAGPWPETSGTATNPCLQCTKTHRRG